MIPDRPQHFLSQAEEARVVGSGAKNRGNALFLQRFDDFQLTIKKCSR